jgi:hypothetical protein
MLSALTITAQEAAGGINHWVVGAIALGLLLALLLALVFFGAGREHS